MTEIVQGLSGFHLLTALEVLDQGVETAASWAADHIVPQPDLGWIVARYVEADKPNRNGHIFPLDQLKASYGNVVHKPLNMLHRRHHVIGAFTAAKLMDGALNKMGQSKATTTRVPMAAAEIAASAVMNPHVETLAAVWKYAFPDEYAATVQAFKEGSAFVSMEAVPKTMTCMACQGEFAYMGMAHDSYCAHLLASPRAPRILNDAHFVGGGIIIPPTRPGWGQADIRDIAGLIEAHPEEAEGLYEAVSAAAPHLSSALWEELMGAVLAKVYPGEPPAPRQVSLQISNAPAAATLGLMTHALTKADDTPAMGPGGPDSEYGAAMVCFVPPAEIAAALAAATAAIEKAEPPEPAEPGDDDTDEADEENEELVPVEEMHVTLGYFGLLDEEGDVSLGDEADGSSMEAACAAVAAYAATARPLVAAVSGAGRFDLGEGNSVIYASIDAPGLPGLREGLVAALAAAGVPVSESHGYSPHMSLEYSDSDEPVLPKIPSGLSWPVTAIEVWWGDEKHSFDLAGS